MEIETPGWVQVGENVKIPYQWGGFRTLAQFDQGLSAGKYAGDRATSGVSSYCVGVDCSGFVSRCWNLPHQYSTRMMNDYITVAYQSWTELQPADAIHKPGHVRLFVDFNPDGSLFTVEAAGYDWRVSYRTFYFNQLTGYAPRYYIFMEGAPGSVPQPELASVLFTDIVRISWKTADTTSLAGYHLYCTENGDDWLPYRSGQILPPDETQVEFKTLENQPQFYKVNSVASDAAGTESYPADVYGYYNTASRDKILIVDGFDRTDGSYYLPYHEFAMTIGMTLSNFNYSFEIAANDAIIDGRISLENYAAVFWLLGDESTADETFSDTEQQLVKAYLQQGGKLLVSGSEIGWDLDHKGIASDKIFFNNFLKTAYDQDDSESYVVSGASGTAFEGLILHYDDGTHGVYVEDYPDAFQPANGSFAALNYGNGLIAATAYAGLVPDGRQPAKIMVIGFPLETIYENAERIELIERLFNFFDIAETSASERLTNQPQKFMLCRNYPNPFNPGTRIRFQLPQNEYVILKIFNLLGQQIRFLVDEPRSAGNYEIYWDGQDDNQNPAASGLYVYQLQAGAFMENRKMMLVR